VRVEREDQLVHVRPFPPEDAQEQRKDGQEEEQRLRQPGEELALHPLGGDGAPVDPGLARSGRTFPGR